MYQRRFEQAVLRDQLRRLWQQISPRRRGQLGLLLLLMMFTSVAEVASIGAVIPFLGALMVPEKLQAHPAFAAFLKPIGVMDAQQLLLPLTMIFIAGALLAGAMRIAFSWGSIRLAYATGADLSYSIYWRALYQPYSVHVSRNSSQIMAAIVTKVNGVINGVLTPMLTLMSSVFLLAAISGVLFVINIGVTLAALLCFGAIYLGVIMMTRAIKRRNGQEIAVKTTHVVKALQEGLGGIRDILLDGSQRTYCDIYRNADVPLRRAQGSNQFIAQSPRYAIEAIGMALIALIALMLSRYGDGIESSVPVLGALAIGAQRLLPVMQQAYAAWSALIGNQPVLEEVLELLEQFVPPEHDQDMSYMAFERDIRLRDISFRYSQEMPLILDGLELSIRKGSRVGIIGKTGSGKTTLVDLIMGLLVQDGGYVEIDGVQINEKNRRAWQSHIAHVPQSIFLTDNSIAENIAFGVPKDKIDWPRARRAAAQAQIASDIEAWPQGYDTRVGERGVCLSGGQRQRIGIARALYKNADVLVFDEATSALDGDTEKAVMDAIEGLSEKLTIIIIAHRRSTLKSCTQIIELIKGGTACVRSYDEISEMSH